MTGEWRVGDGWGNTLPYLINCYWHVGYTIEYVPVVVLKNINLPISKPLLILSELIYFPSANDYARYHSLWGLCIVRAGSRVPYHARDTSDRP